MTMGLPYLSVADAKAALGCLAWAADARTLALVKPTFELLSRASPPGPKTLPRNADHTLPAEVRRGRVLGVVARGAGRAARIVGRSVGHRRTT